MTSAYSTRLPAQQDFTIFAKEMEKIEISSHLKILGERMVVPMEPGRKRERPQTRCVVTEEALGKVFAKQGRVHSSMRKHSFNQRVGGSPTLFVNPGGTASAGTHMECHVGERARLRAPPWLFQSADAIEAAPGTSHL